jgi:hypothetical protein
LIILLSSEGLQLPPQAGPQENIQEKGLVVIINQSSKFEYLVYGLVFVPPIRVAETFCTVTQDYLNENNDKGFQKFKEQIEISLLL